jgi:actin-related protein
MYCGDEVAAIVGDIGYSNARFGYAGEDSPKVHFSGEVPLVYICACDVCSL